MQASSPLPPLSPRTKWLIALCLCVLVMLLELSLIHIYAGMTDEQREEAQNAFMNRHADIVIHGLDY